MKYFYLSFFIILLVPIMENFRVLDEISDLSILRFIDVAMFMTKRYISPKTNTLIIMENCKFACSKHKRYHATLLQHFLKNLNHTLAIQLLFSQSEYRPWDYNLFIVDSWSAFESLRIIIPTTKHERDFYFFILFTWSSDFLLIRNLIQIFELCLRFNVNNVVVMAKSTHNKFIAFYTYQMFNEDHCGGEITVQEINRYENNHLKHDFLFPQLLNNFFKCPLRVTAQISEPLLTFDGDFRNKTHLLDHKRLSGIEGEILKLLAEALNFKIRMLFSEELSAIDLKLNSSSGCFKNLEQQSAQIAIGGLSSSLENNYKFSKSFTYHTTPYKFVVRSNILFGPIKQLLNPLNETTWILLLITFALLIILIQLIEQKNISKLHNLLFGYSNKDPTFNMILTFLGYAMTDRTVPRRNFPRFLLMSWLLLALVIRNGYQGKMFDSLRLSKRMSVPKTIADLIAMDYTLLSSSYTNFYPQNKTLIFHNFSELLAQIESNDKLLTGAVILDSLAHYNYKNRCTSSLTSVDETIYLYQCVMYFSKNSILRESLERKLKAFVHFGITSYIAKKHVRKHFQNMNTRSLDVGRITFGNLRGLYYVYCTLCSISIVVFLLELLSRKSETLKKIMDWMTLI
ncbi:uncharacterized protein ACRADG_009354 [Cochliomyia hominivorax]